MIPSSVHTSLWEKTGSHLQEAPGGSENQEFRSSLEAEGNPMGILAQCHHVCI